MSKGLQFIRDMVGGIRPGSIVLIEGPTGAGKTIFTASIAKEVIEGYGQRVAWIGVLLEPPDIKDIFSNILRINLDDYINSGQFKYYGFEIVPVADRLIMISQLLNDIIDTYSPGMIVIDFIDPIIEFASTSDLLSIRKMIKTNCGEKKCMVLMISRSSLHGLRSRAEMISDIIVRIKMEHPSYGAPRRFIELAKIKNIPHTRMIYELDMNKEYGVTIHPHGILKELKSHINHEVRIPTGIDGFDDILGGGLIRGTSTLLIGPSGVGKTILMLTTAYNMAREGEHVYYISFEEPEQQLVETLRFLGFNMEGLKGDLTIHSINPRTITINSFFSIINRVVDFSKPIVIFIDGLYSLWKEFGHDFHRYVRDLIYYSKSSNATIMLSMIYEKGVEEKLYVWLSTMCDSIIEMNFERTDRSVRRLIYVRKMRLSSPPQKYFEILFENKKLSIRTL